MEVAWSRLVSALLPIGTMESDQGTVKSKYGSLKKRKENKTKQPKLKTNGLLASILFISVVLGREVGCAHVLLPVFLKRKIKNYVIQVTYSNKSLVFSTSLDLNIAE